MEPSSGTDSMFMPLQASTVAADVDSLYYFIHYISVFFFVLIMVMMVVFVIQYRRRPNGPKVRQVSHNTALEVTWSVVPLILVVIIFMWGVRGFMDLRIAPRGAIEIHVSAKKWIWDFEYPNGLKTTNEIVIPIDTPVKLIMSSEDVIHSFFVPNFRTKQDVVPGRYTTEWFQATKLGEHPVFCTEYCGTGHSKMLANVKVVNQEEYEKFLAGPVDDPSKPLTAVGQELYNSKACGACHTLDGSALVGPSFKGLFGKSEVLVDGSSVTVDEAYLRESIIEPNAKVVKGFQPVMPPFKGTLTDRQINGLVEYIKTIK